MVEIVSRSLVVADMLASVILIVLMSMLWKGTSRVGKWWITGCIWMSLGALSQGSLALNDWERPAAMLDLVKGEAIPLLTMAVIGCLGLLTELRHTGHPWMRRDKPQDGD